MTGIWVTDRHTDVDENGRQVVLEDGRIASYEWEQIAGTGGTLTRATSSSATFLTPTGLTADTAYTFRLTVTDDGLTDTDEITIQGHGEAHHGRRGPGGS